MENTKTKTIPQKRFQTLALCGVCLGCFGFFIWYFGFCFCDFRGDMRGSTLLTLGPPPPPYPPPPYPCPPRLCPPHPRFFLRPARTRPKLLDCVGIQLWSDTATTASNEPARAHIDAYTVDTHGTEITCTNGTRIERHVCRARARIEQIFDPAATQPEPTSEVFSHAFSPYTSGSQRAGSHGSKPNRS